MGTEMKKRIREKFREAAKGHDNFKNFSFSLREWSAKPLYFAEDVTTILNDLHLQGRKIKRMKAIGLGYNLREDYLEDAAYRSLEEKGLSEEEMLELSKYENINPETPIYLYAEMDEPFLIEFEDGDIFEILAWDEQTFFVAMNTLPDPLKPGINPNNFNASKLFPRCLGKTIVDFELTKKESCCDFYGNLFHEDGRRMEVPCEVRLILNDGTRIVFSGQFDYFYIDLKDENGETCTAPFREVTSALTDWPAFRTDSITGTESFSNLLEFGEEVIERSSARCIALYTEESDSVAVIQENTFRLFAIAMRMTGMPTADDHRYEYSVSVWRDVLSNAKYLSSVSDYTEYADILARHGIINGQSILPELETDAFDEEGFWRSRDYYEYSDLLKDLYIWTNKVLSDDGKLYIEII